MVMLAALPFMGTTLDFENTTTQVFATTPTGAPGTWTWRHAGMLADHSLALELGADTIQQPEMSRAADGTPLIILTPANDDTAVVVGTTAQGCVALELESVEPPTLRRDRDGRAVVRTSISGTGIGACTHDPESLTGIITTSKVGDGSWTIHASGARP